MSLAASMRRALLASRDAVKEESDPSVLKKAAKIVRLVSDNHAAGLANFLRSLYEENARNGKPKYYVANVLDKADERGWRPIHHAFHLRRYECAKLLIDAGAGMHVLFLFLSLMSFSFFLI